MNCFKCGLTTAQFYIETDAKDKIRIPVCDNLDCGAYGFLQASKEVMAKKN